MGIITKRLQRKRIILFIIVFIWMTLVFYLSSQNGDESTGTSSHIVNMILKIYESITNNKISNEYVDDITYFVRKFAHFTLYFIGAIPIFLFILTYNNKKNKVYIYTILTCAIYACTDEFHQFFIPNRNAAIIDIVIDTCGSVFSVLITKITINILRNIKHKMKYKM